MINKNLINKKISQILIYIKQIEPLAKLDYLDFIGDYKNYRTAERNLQLIIDTAIDINNHIILEKNLEPVDDYYNSFLRLSRIVMPSAFCKKIAKSSGLRNRLVHVYDTINLENLYTDLIADIKDYKKYIKYISNYLKKQ